MAATLTEIAKRAEVSLPLVSRFVNGDPTLRITEERRQRILAAQRELGGIKRSRKKIARAIVAPFSRVWSIERVHYVVTQLPFMRGFEKKMKEKNFRLNFTLFEPDEKLKVFEELIDSPACDAVLLLADVIDKPLAELLLDRRFPHIGVDQYVADFGVNTVLGNALDGIRQAIRLLKSLGHTKIGYLGPRRPRYSVFVAAMTEEMLPIDESYSHLFEVDKPPTGETPLFDSEAWKDYGKQAFVDWCEKGAKATALICGNDMMAFGAIEAMKERGLEPGRDISIVGYDNVEERGSKPVSNPILTTIDNPITELGERAAEVLFNQIFHEQRQIVHEWLPVKLIERKTTGKIGDIRKL